MKKSIFTLTVLAVILNKCQLLKKLNDLSKGLNEEDYYYIKN